MTLDHVPHLSLRSGVDVLDVTGVLRAVYMDLLNIRAKASVPAVLGGHYLVWAEGAVRSLRHRLSSVDMDALVLTRRYWAIAVDPDAAPVHIINTEIDDRVTAFEDVIAAVEGARRRWDRSVGRLVVADTSVFCEHDNKLADLDLPAVLGGRGEPVRLVIPILVLDELEGLKKGSGHVRWRAAHTFGLLDEVLGADGTGLLREEDFTPVDTGGLPRSATYAHVVFDPPRHRRLPINDDELVDRAVAVQTEAGRQVTFLTFDTSQSTRAKFADLAVMKLKRDPGPEPERRQGRRAR